MKCSLCIVFFSLFCLTRFTQASPAPNVWDVLRKQFVLNHETTRPEVQNQIRWIISHPSYIRKLAESEPYIYHIVTEIKKRKLPGEIALIPMIESTYDPFAYSGAGAAGLWQLMPGTGTDLGLKQDWWFDGRRSIRPSTDAALNYLTYLHKFFKGDWLLAFAAYDSGEGTIARLIKQSGRRRYISFWSLPVPRETKAYIPRLLALAAVIQNPKRYNVQLPEIPHLPYFAEVDIGSQIDLDHAAKLAGISYKELIKLNPGYNRWATPPYQPFKLLIPVERVKQFNRNLASTPQSQRVSWTKHQVNHGDSLISIAKKYHTTVNLIKQLNQLKSDRVRKGQHLLIPSAKRPANPKPIDITASIKNEIPKFATKNEIKIIHIVQKQETYEDLQKKYGVSAEDIQRWNLLNSKNPLRFGQQLIIWKRVNSKSTYVVKKGDSLSQIAKLNQLTTQCLLKLNPHISKHLIRPGQILKLS
ncbi:lytic transglycosylase [Legionella londiniensis]|uniref:lytic transglycosylase n=1 Tax=Legionella londiniensis TaxID=45068 RepID=UPI000731DEDA|nr:LysM peptidoglycan-binding domain-containing protein [Legionella londiniensis]